MEHKKGKQMLKKNEALNGLFDSPAKLKVLRFLANTGEDSKYSGREISRFLKIGVATASRILTELYNLKIVFLERVARSNLYYCNKENYIVKEMLIPLFKKESMLLKKAGEFIVSNISDDIMSAVIFGSTARGEDTLESDFDIFILVKNQTLKKKIENHLYKISHDFSLSYGRPLGEYILTKSELLERFKEKMGVVMDIINEGILIAGIRPQSIVIQDMKRRKNGTQKS
jgi:predicted nucleotidyltransferase